MKNIFIAGNWKSNMTIEEARVWLDQWEHIARTTPINPERMSILLFVPFTLLYFMKNEIDKRILPIQLGAQDVSPYPEGAHTGEESARQIKELADWVLIGHSERRSQFLESDIELAYEALQAKTVGLSVLYCVSDSSMNIPHEVDAFAYEPMASIGSGKPEDPAIAGTTIKDIKDHHAISLGLYGGSVTPDNVASYMKEEYIDGVLPGGVSLDPQKFLQLILSASRIQ